MLNRQLSYISILAFVLALGGCASVTVKLPAAPQLDAGPPETQPAYRLQPGDVIELHVFTNPEMNEQAIVAADNRVTFQFAQGITAGGRSLHDLTDSLNQAYGSTAADNIQVVLRSSVGTRVYVTGEVPIPTEVVVLGPLSALSAISRAGGFKVTADKSEVVLMRRDPDNRPHLYALNLAAAMKGKDPSADVLLQPYDVIYVPRSRIGNASLVLETIRNAIPISGTISNGYYYSTVTNSSQ